MKWREFLKPNKWKIILTALILFVPIPFPSETLCNCFPAPCECPTYIGWISTIFFSTSLGWNFIIPLMLVQIILSYFLSSLVVWIYDKVRKKK